jgi:hypothetical protein
LQRNQKLQYKAEAVIPLPRLFMLRMTGARETLNSHSRSSCACDTSSHFLRHSRIAASTADRKIPLCVRMPYLSAFHQKKPGICLKDISASIRDVKIAFLLIASRIISTALFARGCNDKQHIMPGFGAKHHKELILRRSIFKLEICPMKDLASRNRRRHCNYITSGKPSSASRRYSSSSAVIVSPSVRRSDFNASS